MEKKLKRLLACLCPLVLASWAVFIAPETAHSDPLLADFSAAPTRGPSPLEVTFTDASTGTIDTWAWDFDCDGVTDATEQNPTFTFNSPDRAGVYTVALTVTGPAGSNERVKPDCIWVYGPYTRAWPEMDYVPQEMGVFDSKYELLTEVQCRYCHGESLADRHHYTSIVLEQQTCSIDNGGCHEITPEPPGVVFIRDCTTSGCHSSEDVPTNGWHHDTDLSGSENCICCHNPNLVAEITPFSGFQEYPPSVVTPTPFSCDNCHWPQAVTLAAPGFDPDTNPNSDAGHPSTYDHYEWWGDFAGYHEYGKPILGNFDTHHMGFKGNVAAACWKCHANDPNDPSWDPYDPELIRYCETCHDVATLHTIFPHVGLEGIGNPVAVNGWEKTGFNVPGSPGTEPTVYRTFMADGQCVACHGDEVPRYCGSPYCGAAIRIEPQGITPKAAMPGALVELTGECFGEAFEEGDRVRFKKRHGGAQWIDLPDAAIQDWSDTRIEFFVPCALLEPGNYWVRVNSSNHVVLTIKGSCCSLTLHPDSGPCKTLITLLSGIGSFGSAQDTISAPGADDGIFRLIDMVSSQGTFTALQITRWEGDTVKFKVTDFFEDAEPRNYVQDGAEATVSACDSFGLEPWSVHVKSISYRDDDSSGNFTVGDSILQSAVSTPLLFELTNEPYISRIKPTQCADDSRLRLVGINFGDIQTNGEVRIGKKSEAVDPTLGLGKRLATVKHWADSKVVVRLKVKDGWRGKSKFIWLEKDGMKSNYKKVEITAP